MSCSLDDHDALAAIGHFRSYARFVSGEPDRNRYRYYALSWQPSFWGGGAFLRTWGRIGTKGRSRAQLFPDRASAQQTIDELIHRRLHHGYTVVDSH